MKNFSSEFKTLQYIIQHSENILLVAHSRPDADTVGANSALREYIHSLGKKVDIVCYDPFPEALTPLFTVDFYSPDQIDFSQYQAIIACDSVDRGFDTMSDKISDDHAVVLVDHHPNIEMTGDVVIIDDQYSSSAEIVYLFFQSIGAKITQSMATMLLTGLVFDTGSFQHQSSTPQVMSIASELIKKGASLPHISRVLFSNHDISALKLWGKAFNKARLNPENGMLVTAVTKKDIEECHASAEDIYQVATILSTVPNAKFSMVLSERPDNIIRASLRSMSHHGVDVSAIAKRFGGGGHKLASGFEVEGEIVETESGWKVL